MLKMNSKKALDKAVNGLKSGGFTKNYWDTYFTDRNKTEKTAVGRCLNNLNNAGITSAGKLDQKLIGGDKSLKACTARRQWLEKLKLELFEAKKTLQNAAKKCGPSQSHSRELAAEYQSIVVILISEASTAIKQCNALIKEENGRIENRIESYHQQAINGRELISAMGKVIVQGRKRVGRARQTWLKDTKKFRLIDTEAVEADSNYNAVIQKYFDKLDDVEKTAREVDADMADLLKQIEKELLEATHQKKAAQTVSKRIATVRSFVKDLLKWSLDLRYELAEGASVLSSVQKQRKKEMQNIPTN